MMNEKQFLRNQKILRLREEGLSIRAIAAKSPAQKALQHAL